MDAYDYGLPPAAIAQEPVEPRSAARLLVGPGVVDGPGPARATMGDLPGLLRPGDVLVVNDTRVLPARLALAKPSGGRAEVLLIEPCADGDGWEALVRPGRRLPPGTELVEPGGTDPVVVVGDPVDDDPGGAGTRRVRLLDPGVVGRAGSMPLPPYIDHDLDDPERYQTVYSAERDLADRSAAAPTAGLHFTPQVLDELAAKGVVTARVTLHVGLGTFAPLRVERLDEVHLHRERYSLSASAAAAINRAHAEGRRIVAVGTTVVRTLEHCAREAAGQPLAPHCGETEIFISPGFDFQLAGALLTNFHLPQSSLLMLVSAFAGRENVLAAYRHAVEQNYRFFSYGDCMFLA